MVCTQKRAEAMKAQVGLSSETIKQATRVKFLFQIKYIFKELISKKKKKFCRFILNLT